MHNIVPFSTHFNRHKTYISWSQQADIRPHSCDHPDWGKIFIRITTRTLSVQDSTEKLQKYIPMGRPYCHSTFRTCSDQIANGALLYWLTFLPNVFQTLHCKMPDSLVRIRVIQQLERLLHRQFRPLLQQGCHFSYLQFTCTSNIN